MQDLPAVAHRLVEARVGGGYVAVDRHADLESDAGRDRYVLSGRAGGDGMGRYPCRCAPVQWGRLVRAALTCTSSGRPPDRQRQLNSHRANRCGVPPRGRHGAVLALLRCVSRRAGRTAAPQSASGSRAATAEGSVRRAVRIASANAPASRARAKGASASGTVTSTHPCPRWVPCNQRAGSAGSARALHRRARSPTAPRPCRRDRARRSPGRMPRSGSRRRVDVRRQSRIHVHDDGGPAGLVP